MNTEGAIQKRH